MGIDHEIDVKGMECPQPLTVVARELSKIPTGSTFRITTDNYACYMMLLRFLKVLGEEIIEHSEGDDLFVIIGRRTI